MTLKIVDPLELVERLDKKYEMQLEELKLKVNEWLSEHVDTVNVMECSSEEDGDDSAEDEESETFFSWKVHLGYSPIEDFVLWRLIEWAREVWDDAEIERGHQAIFLVLWFQEEM